MRAAVLLLCLTLVVPVAQATDWLGWRKVGDATLTWGPFTVYTSQLRTPDGRYGRENQDQALIITYARDIDRDELVEATRDPRPVAGAGDPATGTPKRSLVTDAPLSVAGCPAGRTAGVCARRRAGAVLVSRVSGAKSLYSTRTASVRSVQHPLPGHLARPSYAIP